MVLYCIWKEDYLKPIYVTFEAVGTAYKIETLLLNSGTSSTKVLLWHIISSHERSSEYESLYAPNTCLDVISERHETGVPLHFRLWTEHYVHSQCTVVESFSQHEHVNHCIHSRLGIIEAKQDDLLVFLLVYVCWPQQSGRKSCRGGNRILENRVAKAC